MLTQACFECTELKLSVFSQVVTHKSLKESYQTIPKAEVIFKHDNGQNRDFICIFELSAENTSTTICAVASIKEVCVTLFLSYLINESNIIINLILKVDEVCIKLLLLFSSLAVQHTCVVFGTLNLL